MSHAATPGLARLDIKEHDPIRYASFQEQSEAGYAELDAVMRDLLDKQARGEAIPDTELPGSPPEPEPLAVWHIGDYPPQQAARMLVAGQRVLEGFPARLDDTSVAELARILEQS